MNTTRFANRAWAFLLAAVMVLTLICPQALAANETIQPAGDKLVIGQTDYALVDGVTETDIFLNTKEGNAQIAGFMTTIAPGAKATFKASYSGYYTEGSTPASRKDAAANLPWNLEKTTLQAAAYTKATGGNVIMAMNGDFYNMQNAQPLGYLIMEGNVIQENNGAASEPYFAVLKDGTYAIRDAGTDCSDVLEAVSGPCYLVKDGQVNHNGDSLIPVNSIGLKADGTVVTFMADGRQSPYSVGMTMNEQAEFLAAQGVVNAIYLDGGGSATYASKREGTSDLTIRNRPSDGVERTVSSALLLVSTAEQDGVFDHASLSPNNTIYTPNSQIRFSAIGVDKNGGHAELPDNVSWSVTDSKCGTIDADGLFTPAKNYKGEVTAQLLVDGKSAGRTTVTIADITDLSFSSAEASLDFGASSDLGLIAKSSGRDIVYKDGDFRWTVTSQTEGVSDADAGSVRDNVFTAGSGKETMNVTVKATYAYDKSKTAEIQVEIGKLPVTLLDFEPDAEGNRQQCAHYHWILDTFANNGKNPDGGYIPKNSDDKTPLKVNSYWNAIEPFHNDGYDYFLWPNGALDDYCCGNLKIVSEAEGGKVRFGQNSMEFNYDYSSYNGMSNVNFNIRYCGESDIYIPGSPTEIGVWVYAPEGTPAYCMYADVESWDPASGAYKWSYPRLTAQNADPERPLQITWTGWMYCKADISDLYSDAEHPIRLRRGRSLIWMSYQPNGNEGIGDSGRKNGTIYFDNYRVVYGTNLDDLDNPVIDEMTINGTALSSGGDTVIASNSIEAVAKYHDVDGKNRSGINAQATTIKIDGEPIQSDNSDADATVRMTLQNGRHTMTVSVSDAFGNTVEKTTAFVVNGTTVTDTATVSVTGSDFVPLGANYALTVTADGKVSSADITMLQLNDDIGQPDVTYAPGVAGKMEYTQTGFKKAMLTLHLEAAAPVEGELAKLSFHIAPTLDTLVNQFTYTVSRIVLTAANGTAYTAAQAAVRLPLSAYYTIVPGPQPAGMTSVIAVYNKDGSAAPGVVLYVDGTEIGKTDANGLLETDAMKDKAAGTVCVLTATGPDGVAEATKVTVLADAGGTAYDGIHLNAAVSSGTAQGISWLSGIGTAGKAVVQCRVKGADAWQTADGTCTLTGFSTSKSAAYTNAAQLTGLTAGTDYEFRVGDGATWSEPQSFRTRAAAQDTTSFVVMGDTQMTGNPDSEEDKASIAVLEKLGAIVKDKPVDFGLQTGDYVDNGSNYAMWTEMQNAFSAAFPGVSFFHALGNHEYYGDASGRISADLLQLPGKDYYSVEYGDVYVAVINNSADLTEACAWLRQDAAQSTCMWKVLSIHQPPYYTNAKNGGSEKFHELIPSAAEAAGIDAVFSGHDHSYARIMARDGAAVTENGVTYFICGDLGEKSRDQNYAISSDFDYAYCEQGYEGLILYVTANDKTMTVSAYDSKDGRLVDSTVLQSRCARGHQLTTYRDGKSVCAVCGKAVDVKAAQYTGWMTVEGTEQQMYFLAGDYVTGWQQLGDKMYHFGDDGIAHVTETVDTRTCTTNGYYLTTCKDCGASYRGAAIWYEGHSWDENHVCTKCGTKGKNIADAEVRTTSVVFGGKKAICNVTVTYQGKKLTVKTSDVNVDGYIYYTNNTSVGLGTVTIKGMRDFYGTVSAQYKILPGGVRDAAATEIGQKQVRLEWSAAAGAENYRVEMSSDGGSTWDVLPMATKPACTVTGLAPATEYTFRLFGCTKVDGKWYSSPYYSNEVKVTTLPDGAFAPSELLGTVSARVDGRTVTGLSADGSQYLFLPASADLNKLALSVDTQNCTNPTVELQGSKGTEKLGKTVNVTKLADADDGLYTLTVLINGKAAGTVCVAQSENLSALYITSDDPSAQGRDFVDASKSNIATAQMLLVDKDGKAVYDGALTQLKARGNTTFTAAEKKSYQIKLGKKSDLVACGEKVKTWTLLAGYNDATLLHDKLFKDLAASLGMPYTAASDWVDLYYDGVYRGTYLVSEKNAVNKTGVDITDMEDAYAGVNAGYGSNMTTATAENRYGQTYRYTTGLTEPANITGGYLLELNGTKLSGTPEPKYDEASGFMTARGSAMNVKSPEWCGKDAMAYISEYYQAFEDAVYAQDADGNYTGYNAETGKYYYEYCDLTSLVQAYLLQSLSGNSDAFYSSLFFYKDADGLMYAGPVWDMEMTCGSGWNGYIGPDNDFINGRYLVTALLKIPGFRAAVSNYYHDTFLAQAQQLVGDDGKVMTGAARLSASAAMNYRQWPLIRVGNPNQSSHFWPAGTTYADTVADMNDWLTKRIVQMSAVYDHTWDAGVVTKEPTCAASGTRVYTNDVGETMTEAIPAKPHTPETLPAVAATCTASGLTEGCKCAVCGATLTAQKVIPAAHHYVDGVCTVCGAEDPTAVPCPGGEACPGHKFTDMPSTTSWAHNGIDFVVAHKLFAGTSDTTFEPNTELTRAMIVEILYCLEGEPAVEAENPFTDVSGSAWYTKAVLWAASNNIVAGIGNGRFDPNGTATREQAATILYEYARFKGCDVDVYGDLSAFADAGSVSAFARAPMTWAVAEGLISGAVINGQTLLDPQGVTTRAQFAMIMMQYVLNVVKAAPEAPTTGEIPSSGETPAQQPQQPAETPELTEAPAAAEDSAPSETPAAEQTPAPSETPAADEAA